MAGVSLKRREFLYLVAGASGAAMLAACQVQQVTTPSASPEGPTTIGKFALGKLEGPEIITDPNKFPKTFKEAPELADLVKAGKLPSVADRVGQDPIVIKPVHEIGAYGGTIRRAFIGLDRSLNPLGTGPDSVVYYDYQWKKVVPVIAKAYEISSDQKVVTIHLRRGMKWSDGVAFTADDFMFWYQDMYLNKSIVAAPNPALRINGKDVTMEKVDDVTVRWVSPDPNPIMLQQLGEALFLGGQAFNGWRGQGGFAPKHYLMQFHPKYVGQAAVDKLAADAKFTSWPTFFLSKNEWLLNADLPVVAPWVVVKGKEHNTDNWQMQRNPYSVWVDTDGNQLPYVSDLRMAAASNADVVALRAIAGDLDFQERYMQLGKLPVFLQNEQKVGYKVHLTPSQTPDLGVRLDLSYTADPEVGDLFRKVSFRRALSLGIDRAQFIEAFFLGAAEPWSAAPSESNPYFPGKEYVTKWATLDLAQANKLLDDIGLTKKDSDGFRLRKDGSTRLKLEITQFAGDDTGLQEAEMLKQQWAKIGIDLTVATPIAGAISNDRAIAGQLPINMNNVGSEDPFLDPDFVVPIQNSGRAIIGIPYANWWLTKGASGREPFPEVKQILELWDKGFGASDADRVKIGQDIFRLHIDQVFSIGIVGPSVSNSGIALAKNNIGNMPDRWLNARLLRNGTIAAMQTWYIKK